MSIQPASNAVAVSGTAGAPGDLFGDGRSIGTQTPALNHGEFRRRSYFPGLDGLRALSILLVLAHHVTRSEFTLWGTLQENGRFGVSFFFVISGFLICTLLLRERDRTGRIAWGRFYARRALRLLPLYYAALAVQCVLVFALHFYTPENQQLFRDKLPAYLFYYNNWLETATVGPFFCAWSLAIEEQFYLGFGLLLWLVPQRRLIGLFFGALCIKFLTFQFVGPVDSYATAWRVLFSYQEAILWGVLLAFALNNAASYARVSRTLSHPVIPIVTGSAVAACLLLYTLPTQHTWEAQFLYLGMAVFVGCVVVRRSVPVLGFALLTHIGKISYGMYLLHMFVISSVRKLPIDQNAGVAFSLSAALTIAVASAVYYSFELPIIEFYKRRFSPPATAPAARRVSPPAPHPLPSPRSAILPTPPGTRN